MPSEAAGFGCLRGSDRAAERRVKDRFGGRFFCLTGQMPCGIMPAWTDQSNTETV